MSQAEEKNAEVRREESEETQLREGLPFADTTMSLSAQAPVELQPGVILLEKFKIIELLGVGGMGSVYRVNHLFMNQQYALKCLNICQRNDINWRRFENEAKAANMLDHANLLRVFEFGLLPGGRPYFLMELVNGVTLADEVRRLGRLPMKRAIKIFIQVAFAIHYAHEHGIIHRDLKPSNIMLEKKEGEENETVKIVDFGIAKLTGVDEFNQQTLTKTGEIFGSPLYMSPEQCSGTAIDNRSDLYSLGCLFYEALTSAPPFIGETALATMMKHQNELPLSLQEASMGIGFPSGLEKIVATLLEKDPDLRYQKANSLAADLIELERTLSGDADSTPATQQIGKLRADRGKAFAQTPADNAINTILIATLTLVIGAVAGAGICYVILSGQIKDLKAYYEDREASAFPFEAAQQNAPPSKVSPEQKASPQAGSYSKIVGDQRILTFPKGMCLGTIIDDFAFVTEAEGKKKFPKQRRLSLMVRNNAIESPDLLAGFAADDLVFLNFSSAPTFKSDGFSAIENLTGLKAINLKHTLFNNSALLSLEKMVNLRYANFNHTRVHGDGLAKLAILPNLNALDVSNNSGMLPFCQSLSELKNLYELQMQHCQLDDVTCKDISQCQSIRVLCISQNKDITDAGVSYLKDLKNLAWLDLTATSVSPNCLESLLEMRSLRKVELGELDWTDSQKKAFEKAIKTKSPAVKIFWNDQETSNLGQNLPDFKWDAGNLK
ncbi:MAG: protein kinase [Candidatus Melainabacteria bacterium]|nr:protein kinase [Candidatus Melainabacteria bacterium]